MATDRFAPTADLPRLTKEVMVLTTYDTEADVLRAGVPVDHVVLVGVPESAGPWPALTRTDSLPVGERQPGCALDVATRAGSA